MNVPITKILNLLNPSQSVELRSAALTVLAEVGGRDAAVAKAVIGALSDADGEVRLRAIRAAGKLRIEKSVPALMERIRAGGVEAEAAADMAARLGSAGPKALHELMPRVAPGLRRYIAAALAGAGASGGDIEELTILLDKDPAVVDAAAGRLAAAIPNLSDPQRRAVADELLKLAGNKKTRLPEVTEAAVLRLAGLLDDPRSTVLFWDRVLPPHPPEARAAALQALGKWVTSPSKDERDRLFQCAAERDFRIVAPALMILDKLNVTEKTISEWVPLLHAPDVAARRVALSKIGDRDRADIVDALLDQIRHSDRAYRDEVLARLAGTSKGRAALCELLKEASSYEAAWDLARVVAPLSRADPEHWLDELFPKACGYLESGDRMADPLFFVLREADAHDLRDRLEKRAQALVKKRDFETAHQVYRGLARDPSIGFPLRLGLAACGLKISAKDVDREARSHDACLGHFAELARQDEAAVMSYLTKTSWLGAEELYYLGFHFAEHTDKLRDFGADLLRLVIKRHGRTKLAQTAKNKLKSCGLN